MFRRILIASVACFLLSSTVANAEDFLPKILKYFPGKWEVTNDDGSPFASIEWKLVAGGKAIAGIGKSPNGAETQFLAGWDPSEKEWNLSAYSASGACVRLELTKLEGDTYHGTFRFVGPNGEVIEALCRKQVIDEDRFDLIHVSKDRTWVHHWRRVKQ